MSEYWYNVTTGEVEEGRRSSWKHLMGPYSSRQAAEQALEQAHERSESYDEMLKEEREG
ncbi:SPOR domain-containing protein [Nesterenkonia sp. NBAIMH1]|uniref:SPOR domain-containing protein n=1 Tax=Nesterenkonia sp. NBAIMH1 TaxID=2600320 RepID=UPI0011B5A38D|nr:SPOR domain-containing protein [Nesterenkonia sp. NBAIMH1]